jgi:diguanylate cyclase (GGDEF)-like protein
VISLKKYLEMEIHEPATVSFDAAELQSALLDSYRSALLAMGATGAQACPAISHDLQQNLTTLEGRLASNVTPPLVKQTERQLNHELQQWANQAVAHSAAEAAEVKELLLVLAQTAASVGERDQSYATNLHQFTTRLRTISNLDDLTNIRASLLQQAAELKTYVVKMQQESQKLVAQLKTKISTYETKLKQVEDLALRDPLTTLPNRRYLEERIASRIALAQGFCVIVLDVNQLKKVNDVHGHLAGDNLLQQFAQELRSSFRASDLVGRWGGDEFIVVTDGDSAGAQAQIDRMQKWVFGEYTIRPGKGTGEVKTAVTAAVGLAEWKSGETAKSLFERADAAMYAQKVESRKRQGRDDSKEGRIS